VWLAWLTRKLEKAWFKTSSDQLGVTNWLEFVRRFDSEEMKRARKRLAEQLKDYTVSKHKKVSETALNFFEDVGTTYREGYLNKKLADSTFGFYACRWWEASKAYIDHEQKRHKEDTTLFADFRHIADVMRLPDEVIDHDEIQRFLEDEMQLD
jgi:hypothetical protein